MKIRQSLNRDGNLTIVYNFILSPYIVGAENIELSSYYLPIIFNILGGISVNLNEDKDRDILKKEGQFFSSA